MNRDASAGQGGGRPAGQGSSAACGAAGCCCAVRALGSSNSSTNDNTCASLTSKRGSTHGWEGRWCLWTGPLKTDAPRRRPGAARCRCGCTAQAARRTDGEGRRRVSPRSEESSVGYEAGDWPAAPKGNALYPLRQGHAQERVCGSYVERLRLGQRSTVAWRERRPAKRCTALSAWAVSWVAHSCVPRNSSPGRQTHFMSDSYAEATREKGPRLRSRGRAGQIERGLSICPGWPRTVPRRSQAELCLCLLDLRGVAHATTAAAAVAVGRRRRTTMARRHQSAVAPTVSESLSSHTHWRTSWSASTRARTQHNTQRAT